VIRSDFPTMRRCGALIQAARAAGERADERAAVIGALFAANEEDTVVGRWRLPAPHEIQAASLKAVVSLGGLGCAACCSTQRVSASASLVRGDLRALRRMAHTR
jgi:hypothetical protein